MQTGLSKSQCTTVALCLLSLVRQCCTAAKSPRAMIGPSVLHSDSEDEDIIVSSGHAWGSGSGSLAFEGYSYENEDDEDDDIPSTKATLLKLVTPDSTRMTCIVCTTVGDQSCRDPYVRNSSHVQPCQTQVEGCLKVVTPSGDTYRNCLYGIFATAEKNSGCRVIKEDVHVGHKFVNATICICRTNECNGMFYTTPTSPAELPVAETTNEIVRSQIVPLMGLRRKSASAHTLAGVSTNITSSTASPTVVAVTTTVATVAHITTTSATTGNTTTGGLASGSELSSHKYSHRFMVVIIGFLFSILITQ